MSRVISRPFAITKRSSRLNTSIHDRAQQALGEPAHLGARVHEDLPHAHPPRLPFFRSTDLDVHAERAHTPAAKLGYASTHYNTRQASIAQGVPFSPRRSRAPPPTARRPPRAAGPRAA